MPGKNETANYDGKNDHHCQSLRAQGKVGDGGHKKIPLRE
jgi:hypothetical protein